MGVVQETSFIVFAGPGYAPAAVTASSTMSPQPRFYESLVGLTPRLSPPKARPQVETRAPRRTLPEAHPELGVVPPRSSSQAFGHRPKRAKSDRALSAVERRGVLVPEGLDHVEQVYGVAINASRYVCGGEWSASSLRPGISQPPQKQLAAGFSCPHAAQLTDDLRRWAHRCLVLNGREIGRNVGSHALGGSHGPIQRGRCGPGSRGNVANG